jgi:DDE superfamily endonuclease
MAIFSNSGIDVVLVVDRRGIHRAHKLNATLDHYHGKLRFHFLPAHCGYHLNPLEGFWRVLKDTIGAGRCFGDLQQLYQRSRRVLMAHQERPVYLTFDLQRKGGKQWVPTRIASNKSISFGLEGLRLTAMRYGKFYVRISSQDI